MHGNQTSDLAAHKIHVTFFKNFAAESLTTAELTLPELRDRILAASAATKDSLPWLKLASFGKKRSDKNSLRHDANVIPDPFRTVIGPLA